MTMQRWENARAGRMILDRHGRVWRGALLACLLLIVATMAGGASRTVLARIGAPRGDIVGGAEADPGEWPWQVAILFADEPDLYYAQYCGGSLIDPEWVVTAAHCVTNDFGEPMYAREVKVGVGIHDLNGPAGQVIRVGQVFVHPGYGDEGSDDTNDIALLRLVEPAPLGPTVQTIPLVETVGDAAIQSGQQAMITGWGQREDGTYPSELYEVAVPIVASALCDTNASAVCAGDLGHDTCYGDSGGPLVAGGFGGDPWRLAGLTSAGTTEVCGGPDNYTLYTSLPYYRAWILATMAIRSPALEVIKLATETISREGVIGYSITVTNVGRAPATDVVVTDEMPAGVLFVSAGEGGQRVGSTVTWTVGVLDAGAQAVVSFRVRDLPGMAPLSGLTAAEMRGPSGAATGRSGPRAIDPRWSRPDRRRGVDQAWGRAFAPGGRNRHVASTASSPAGVARPGAPAADSVPDAPTIIGGSQAALGEWPWQVALVQNGEPDPINAQYCAGTLIDPEWVLTAAHCVVSPWGIMAPGEISVRMGIIHLTDSGGQRIAVAQVIPNLRYFFDYEFDVALLKLEHAATINSAVRPIPFARRADLPLLDPGKIGTVTGWGAINVMPRDYPDELYEVELPVIDNATCGALGDIGLTLCAGPLGGGRSACYGDSGGPMVFRAADGSFVLGGVVSRGTAAGCGAPGEYTLFAKPSAFGSWIDDKMIAGWPDELIVNTDYRATAAGGLEATGNPAFTVVGAPDGELGNLATRAPVLTGDNVLIAGFIVSGGPLKVALRAKGPSLAASGVPDTLQDPVLRLFSGQAVVAENDDWANTPGVREVISRQMAPTDARESVILTTLQPGAYTAIVQGKGGMTGNGLVEVFRIAGGGSLVNLATRARVETGDRVMIGGFIVQNRPTTVVVRAIGPSMAAQGVAGALQNPTLEIFKGQVRIDGNDNWQSGSCASAAPATFHPKDPREACVILTLEPGAYTAIVRGAGGTTGVGLVEAFRVWQPGE